MLEIQKIFGSLLKLCFRGVFYTHALLCHTLVRSARAPRRKCHGFLHDMPRPTVVFSLSPRLTPYRSGLINYLFNLSFYS